MLACILSERSRSKLCLLFEYKTNQVQHLFNLNECLRSHAVDGKDIIFFLADKSTHGADIRLLERVRSTSAQVECLDTSLEYVRIMLVFYRLFFSNGFLLRIFGRLFLKTDDRLQLMYHNFNRAFKRLSRRERAVGFDKDAEAIIVGLVAEDRKSTR